MKYTLHTIIICFLALALQVAKAQPGHNDLTFNPNDVGSNYGVKEGGDVYTIAKQSDGKIIVGGSLFNGHLARLNTDLSVDDSFQNGVGFGNGATTATVYSISLQSNGKIIVVGNFTTYNNQIAPKIARLNTDGTLDTTFSSIVINSFSTSKVIVQPDDKILLGVGQSTNNDPTALVRLNPNGDLDSTFFIDTTIKGVSDIKLLNSGQIYAVALKYSTAPNTNYRIIRLNADGTTDSTFQFLTNSNPLLINTLDVQSDGKVIVGGGSFLTIPNNPYAKCLVRLNLDGSIDSTFTHSLNSGILKLEVLSTDEILIVGPFSYTNINGTLTKYIGRLSANGNIDTQFFSEFNYYIPRDFVIENNGSIVCSLSPRAIYKKKYYRYALRLDSNGNIDTTLFQSQGAGGEIVCSVTQPDGKIVYAGRVKNYNGWGANYILRLNVDGSIDTSFQSFLLSKNLSTMIQSLSLQSDGKILVGRMAIVGAFYYMGTAVTYLFRLNTDGTLDNTFVTNLSGVIPQTSTDTHIYCSLALPNNKILVGGNFTKYGTSTLINANALILLNNNGTRDPLSSAFSANKSINRLTLDLNGKILAGGNFTTINGASLNKLARFDTLGVIDTTFHIGSGFNFWVEDIIVLPDDKILVSGGFTTYNGDSIFRIARLHPNGNLDTTFNIGNQFRNSYINSMALQSDGKIIVGGYYSYVIGTVDSAFIKRLNSDGSIDSTFRTIITDDLINTIDVQNNGTAMIGGEFRRFDNYPRNFIARILLNPCNAPTFTSTTSAHRCDAGVLTLQANANAGNIKWFTVANGGFSVGTGSSFTTPFLNTTKTYYVEATDSNCTSNRIAITASILGTTINNQTLTICNGSSITVGTNNYNTSGVYVDSLTTSLGCDSVVTTTLNIVTNFTSNVTATICAGESYSIAQHTYTATGVYSDTLTAIGGCDSIIVTNLTVLPNYIINNPQNICAGNSYNFNGNTYSIAGNYNDTLQTINGCDSIVVTQLTINPLPIAPTISAMGSTTFCSGSSLMLMGNNGGTWSNASAANDLTVNVAGNYYVVATNSCGSDTSNVITVTVNPLPNNTVIQTTNTLTANQTSATYQWIDCSNNASIAGQTNQSFTPIADGNYSVVINSNNGCIDTSSCYLILLPDTNCHAQFTLYADTIVAHHYYALNQCTGSGTINYTWSWGDGSANSTGATPSHQYNAPGYYTICVTINDSAGCTSTYCDSSTYITKSMANTIISVDVVNVLPPPIVTGAATPSPWGRAGVGLFPNPANTFLNISGVLNQKLEIQNVLGETVFSKHVISNLETIDLSGFAKGVYFVRVNEKSMKFMKE